MQSDVDCLVQNVSTYFVLFKHTEEYSVQELIYEQYTRMQNSGYLSAMTSSWAEGPVS